MGTKESGDYMMELQMTIFIVSRRLRHASARRRDRHLTGRCRRRRS
jgi:hypothetical protein